MAQTQTAPPEGTANEHPKITAIEASTEASNGSLPSTGMRCPDPSVHTKNTSLQDHASAAALYSTKGSSSRDINPLGPDGKLSSASAATSLKYARAHDLPSYPVVGIDTASSAGGAALLAHSNAKSPETWKPEQSSAAGKAALLAHDYKMAPQWQPAASAAGSKAALLAHTEGVKLKLWQPEASAHGNSAALLAMKNQPPSKAVDYGYTDDGRKKALIAATGAVTSSGRKRAQSTPPAPPLYPDSANSARNALTAATIAHTPSTRASNTSSPVVQDSNRLGSGAMEAARIQHSKSIAREMYTERPPIRMEREEKERQDALRASAISMAKNMYDVQQKHIDQAAGLSSQSYAGATTAHGQQRTTAGEEDIKQQAMRYIGIQEAAQKLAAERLAKIGTDDNAAFRSYYGYEKPMRAKLSMRRGRPRAKTNPETSDSDDDDFRSRRIRSQMSQLNKSVAEIDAKKREQDRKNLIAAAQRKVQSQMSGMDKKIFDETGKMSPAMIEEWDAKARARAAAASEARMENHGKVHIGNGVFMDQAEIDAIAAGRIQPTLDEITQKTEKRRAEDEERRLDEEEKKRQARIEKERAAELKAEEKRIKDEERTAAKSRSAEEKAAAKQEKEVEKTKKAEEKRLLKEEKRKSRDTPKTGVNPADLASPVEHTDEEGEEEDEDDELYRRPEPLAQGANHTAAAETSAPASPRSPTSPESPTKAESKGFMSLLSKFKRRRKSAATADTDKPGFIGGASLRASSSHSKPMSSPASPQVGPATSEPTHNLSGHDFSGRRYSDVSSVSDVPASSDHRGRSPERTTSGTSGMSGGTDFEEARDDFDEKLIPPPSFTSSDSAAGRKGSPNRDSRFYEVGI